MGAVSEGLKDVRFKAVGLVDQIADVITDGILQGRYPEGEQLVEKDLQARFGTSRTPIREAFRVLEKKGLVQIVPRRGTFVKVVTRKDIEEQFSVRAALEGLAARQAYGAVSPMDVTLMERTLRNMESAVERGDLRRYREFHYEFHEIFIRATGNDVLIDALKPLRLAGIWYNYSQHYFVDDLHEILEVHQRIHELFARQAEGTGSTELQDLVQGHIEVAMHKFLTYFDTLEH